MEADREKMLEKLRKLFALGKSSNQHEAELAMQKASEIMEEYQISATEVDLQEAGRITREDIRATDGYGIKHWIFVLARASAKLYNGDAAYSADQTHLHFIGTKTDIEAIKMTFAHLHDSWKSIVEADLRNKKTAWREEWKACGCPPTEVWAPKDTMSYKHGHGVGYATALDIRIDAIVRERNKHVKAVSVTGNSLVVVKDLAIKDYKETRGYTSHRTTSSGGDAGGRTDGYNAGRAVPLGGIEHRTNHLIGRA